MIDAAVAAHLEKYYRLARDRFVEGDAALATFFALTAIEECGKLLILRDTAPGSEQARKLPRDHELKYLLAMVNFLTASERFFDDLPTEWQGEVWSLMEEGGKHAKWLRNDSLYLYRDRRGEVHTPDRRIDMRRATPLVYLAGQALVELDEYVSELEPAWIASILRDVQEFRILFLDRRSEDKPPTPSDSGC